MGDRVSYSYTIWSIGTTYKMLGDYKESRKCFKTARYFFDKTKDPRGIIYCNLGLGEIALLEERKKLAEKYFIKSIKDAKQYGFMLESCHSEMLESYLFGKIKRSCYNKLGLKLHFKNAPFNIP